MKGLCAAARKAVPVPTEYLFRSGGQKPIPPPRKVQAVIEFFLSPQRIKLLLAGGGILLAASAALLIAVVCLSGKLETERAEHQTTRLERDDAVAEGLRWKAVADAAEPKITALQAEARECLAREAQAPVDAADRAAIINAAVPRERTAEERKGVVDEATRRKAAVRLSRPL